jgi:hypothetical protein
MDRDPQPAASEPEPGEPDYLAPYARAVELHGAGFGALLIADRSWQEARFAAFAQLLAAPLGGLAERTLADLGSGRADLLTWLLDQGIGPRRYLGVEAIAELDHFARIRAGREGWSERLAAGAGLIHADFVADPGLCDRLVREQGADLLWFGGSLNTLEDAPALAVLERAWAALERTPEGVLAFNFLAGPTGASASDWPRPSTGLPRRDTQAWFAWACARTPRVLFAQHYLGAHDATLVLIR